MRKKVKQSCLDEKGNLLVINRANCELYVLIENEDKEYWDLPF